MVLPLTGPRSTGVEVAEASANPPGAGCAPSSVAATIGATGCCGSATEPVTAEAAVGITMSMAAFATTPNATAPLTQASESKPIRADFIVSPTLPLGLKCGIRVNKVLPESSINKAIWWQATG